MTPGTVVARYVEGAVIPVGVVQHKGEVEVHGVAFTLHYLLVYVN